MTTTNDAAKDARPMNTPRLPKGQLSVSGGSPTYDTTSLDRRRRRIEAALKELWADPAALARRLPKQTFLAAAIDQIGAAKYARDWAGAPAEMKDAYGKRSTRRNVARDRLKSIATIIADAAVSGILPTMTRPIMGGGATKMAPAVWQTEEIEWRFIECRMNPRKPFDPDCAVWGECEYIFVETAGLQRVARSLASEEDAGPPPKAAMRPSAEAVSAYYQKHVASDGLRLNEETWLPIAKEHFRSLAPPRELSRTQWRNAAARFPPGRRGRRRD